MEMNRDEFDVKPHWEFGAMIGPDDETNEQRKLAVMPNLKDFDISVMYRTFSGDAILFGISLTTVRESLSAMTFNVDVVLKVIFSCAVRPHAVTGLRAAFVHQFHPV